jgi:adenosylcobyric acid synthase
VTARALMVQGTSSSAGKSLIATALCRHFARQGLRVAPFKAQNMSNNARVVAGGEIGVAQWLQARAAGVEPEVRMNPVLVKPEGDTRSQVVLSGVADAELSALPWPERAPRLVATVDAALASLRDDFDLVVLEGAGSPAEINLARIDLTNARAARRAGARVLLVCDIDRGGAFAHLYGTWALLEPEDRDRVAGFVLNRFRGDAAVLAPGPERLAELTGVPTLGVVPWIQHGLPDEDGAAAPAARGGGRARVAIVRYPTASNLDEFKALEQAADVRWTVTPADLDGTELAVLPGSKHVAADLRWLRATGLAGAVVDRAVAGARILGICGGLQMLGERVRDAAGVDGDGDGLRLLPLATEFGAEKLTAPASARFGELDRPWEALSGRPVRGYEIRHGRTRATGAVDEALPAGRGWVRGPVLGVTLHGLLEDPGLVAALVQAAPSRSLETVLDELTDAVMAGLDPGRVDALVAGAPS